MLFEVLRLFHDFFEHFLGSLRWIATMLKKHRQFHVKLILYVISRPPFEKLDVIAHNTYFLLVIGNR